MIFDFQSAPYVIQFDAVGSRRTVNPPPVDTDDDHIVLSIDQQKTMNFLVNNGYTCSSGNYCGENFTSLRKNEINVILTDKKEYYDNFMLATHVAKSLNLLDKQQRIVLFQAILYKVKDERLLNG